MGRWLCRTCGQMLCQDSFRLTRAGRLSGSCRECQRKAGLLYRRTLRGSLKTMHGHAAHRARMKGLEFSLSYAELIGMLESQNGKCAYSGVGMEVEQPNSHWRMSLERVNNRLGYTASNCVLVAAEFNSFDFSRAKNVDPESVLGTAQWSLQKVEQVSKLQPQPMDLDQLAVDIKFAQVREREPRARRTSDSATLAVSDLKKCSSCLQVLPTFAFYAHPSAALRTSSSCKECCRQRQRLYYRTLRGHLHQCLGSARIRARLRAQDFAITAQILLDFLAEQGGRCFYSGVPLQYKQVHTDWRLSLERLDHSVGYTPDNCVLIAAEFNTSDQSRNSAVTEVFGTAQWSREKVWHVWGF